MQNRIGSNQKKQELYQQWQDGKCLSTGVFKEQRKLRLELLEKDVALELQKLQQIAAICQPIPGVEQKITINKIASYNDKM